MPENQQGNQQQNNQPSVENVNERIESLLGFDPVKSKLSSSVVRQAMEQVKKERDEQLLQKSVDKLRQLEKLRKEFDSKMKEIEKIKKEYAKNAGNLLRELENVV